MKKIFADLHTHTIASDGCFSPHEIILKAKSLGLSALAITDHDTISAIDKATQIAQKEKIQLIAGCELSCYHKNFDFSIHILGYFSQKNYKKIELQLLSKQKSRLERAIKICDLLEKKCNIPTNLLKEKIMNCNTTSIGRPMIARYLIENNFVSSIDEAFKKYLTKGKPAYVSKETFDPFDAIDLIQNCGGLAILAHPGIYNQTKHLLELFKNSKINGLEVFYPEHNFKETKDLYNYAIDNNWLITGGSDEHGDNTDNLRLGSKGLTKKEYEKFKEGLE